MKHSTRSAHCSAFWENASRALLLMFAAVSVQAASVVAAAEEEEQGFVALTGADVRDHWLGYGLDEAKDAWPASWEYAEGILHSKGGGNDLKTRKLYGDFDLRFEWKTVPNGNSGVMYRVSQEQDPAYHTGPEYQLLDQTEGRGQYSPKQATGAIYDLYAPTKEVEKSAGEWNTSRIVIQDNHLTHFLNGEKVAESVMGGDDWNRRLAASKFKEWKKFGKNLRGHIVLQDHGDETWFRNIRIKSLDPQTAEKK